MTPIPAGKNQPDLDNLLEAISLLGEVENSLPACDVAVNDSGEPYVISRRRLCEINASLQELVVALAGDAEDYKNLAYARAALFHGQTPKAAHNIYAQIKQDLEHVPEDERDYSHVAAMLFDWWGEAEGDYALAERKLLLVDALDAAKRDRQPKTGEHDDYYFGMIYLDAVVERIVPDAEILPLTLQSIQHLERAAQNPNHRQWELLQDLGFAYSEASDWCKNWSRKEEYRRKAVDVLTRALDAAPDAESREWTVDFLNSFDE